MSIFDSSIINNPLITLHRTFHPVGQGAFYTEVFFIGDNSVFTVVYDCGSETGPRVDFNGIIDDFKKHINHIDLLFISHFHADHINGLDKLLDGIHVAKTVIPMLDPPTITVTRLQNYIRYSLAEADNADRIIKELFFGVGESNRFGEVIMVTPETKEGKEGNDNSRKDIAAKGKKLLSGGKLLYDNFWEYIPFNSIDKNDLRAKDLQNRLKLLSLSLGLPKFDLSSLIKWHLKEVKHEYRDAMQGANDNLYSLVVVSQPAAGIVPQFCPRLAHCLYFGDFDHRQKNKPWYRLKKIINYSEIGTVQVPHHGAKGNWFYEMGIGDPRHYIVSAGSTNKYHHPNYWVLLDIWERGHKFFVVSEKTHSKCEYYFYIV